jgi:hypothetical protein
LAQEKVCECFNADFFQAIKLIYGYALRAIPKGWFLPLKEKAPFGGSQT